MRRYTWIWIITLFILVGCQNAPVPASPTPTQEPPSQPTSTLALTPIGETGQPTEQPTDPTAAPTLEPTEEITPTAEAGRETEPAGTPIPPLTSGKELTVTEVKMVNPTIGWAVGTQGGGPDHILFTSDGGETWDDRSPPARKPERAQRFQAWGYFLNSQTAWVIYAADGPPPVSPKVVWKTTDSGISWEASQTLPLTGQEPFFEPEGFSFVNSSTGWLLVHVDAGMSHDYSHLYRTADGGQTWERIVDPFGESLQGLRNTGMAFSTESYGWVTKDNLGVLPGAFLEQTEDGGQSWENIFLPAPEGASWESEPIQCRTFQPVFTSPQTGLVLLECSRPDGSGSLETLSYVYSTSDRGENWQHTQLPSPVSDLEFVDLQVGYAAGIDIYKTTNGGLDWVKIKTVTWHGQLTFISSDLGWAVARKGEDIALVKTENGGSTWQIVTPIAAP